MKKLNLHNITRILYSLLLSTLIACSSKMEKVNENIDRSLLDSEQADSVTLKFSTNGLIRAQLSAKKFNHILSAKPPYLEMKQGLKIDFYDAQGKASSTLTARKGRYFEDNNNVLIQDSVVVNNIKKEELRTDELIWNDKTQTFFTEKPVTITTPTQILYGNGMEANQDFTYFKIFNIKGVIQVKNGTLPKY